MYVSNEILKNQHSLNMFRINYNLSVDYKKKQFPIQDFLNPLWCIHLNWVKSPKVFSTVCQHLSSVNLHPQTLKRTPMTLDNAQWNKWGDRNKWLLWWESQEILQPSKGSRKKAGIRGWQQESIVSPRKLYFVHEGRQSKSL